MMIPEEPLETKEIAKLLSELKSQTPEYPAELLEARRAAFLKQIVTIKIEGKDQDGEGGKQARSGAAGGSGATLAGGKTSLGIILKVAIAVGVIAVLTAAYIYRDQIVDTLSGNNVESVEATVAPSIASTPANLASGTPGAIPAPALGTSPPGIVATEATPGLVTPNLGGAPSVMGTSNPSLIQTPEATSTPGQGGPRNIFQYLICILQSSNESCR